VSHHGRLTRRRRWSRSRPQRGSAALCAVLLSPVLMLGLALAVEVGAFQLERQRVREAADEAAVSAAAAAAAADGAVGVERARAAALMRAALAAALRPLQAELGADADVVAAGTEVAVVDEVPAADPFLPGAVVRLPSVEARVRVPLRTGLLQLAAVPASVAVTVVTGAELRRAAEGDR
jgi:Flp pilus assembly protein TadG